jgi:hypothetical protein
MSACADLVLDGRPSLGTAGRAMRFDWDVVPGPTNWRAVQQYLHTHSDGAYLLLSQRLLPAGELTVLCTCVIAISGGCSL